MQWVRNGSHLVLPRMTVSQILLTYICIRDFPAYAGKRHLTDLLVSNSRNLCLVVLTYMSICPATHMYVCTCMYVCNFIIGNSNQP